MVTPINSRDLELQATSPRVLGVSTNYVTLTAPSLQFKYGTDNLPQPTQIIVTASLVGMLQGTVTFSTTGFTVPPTVNPANANQLIIDPDNFSGDYATISASINYLGSNYEAVPLSISRVFNQLVAKVSRPLDLIPSYNDGSGYTLPTEANSVELYNGVVRLDSGVTYGPATQTSNGLTIAVDSATGAITLSQSAPNTWSGSNENFNLTATRNGVTYTTTYTITKAKAGAGGQQTATLELYIWSISQPALPTGTSTLTWTTNTHVYSDVDSWRVVPPANPGTANISLWKVKKGVLAEASLVNTQISATWTTGASIEKVTLEANATIKTFTAKVYAATPSATPPALVGTSTLTWSTSAYTAPTNWSLTAPAAVDGQTLYEARVVVQDSVSSATTVINWTTASILPITYYATDGASARRAYVTVTTTPSGTPATYTATGDALPATGTWFTGKTWSATAPTATLAEGETVYQSDGVYVSNGNTTWGYPYISTLRVGNLAAVSTNTGALTVTGDVTGGSATAFGTGTGYVLTSDGKFRVGTAAGVRMEWNGTGLSIYNASNTAILSAGQIQWSALTGVGKPQDSATRNVFLGDWVLTTTYVIGDVIYYNGSSWSCILGHTSTALNAPAATGTGSTYWAKYGAVGNSPPTFGIANTAVVFTKNAAGTVNPSAGLLLVTSFLGLSGTPTYQWQKNGVNISGATAANYTVPAADYDSVLTNTYKCTLTGVLNGSPVTLIDQITVPLLLDGSSAISVVNSNENVTFTGPTTGYTFITFTGGATTVTAYLGSTQLAYAASGANTFSCTKVSTGVTTAAATTGANTFTVPAPTAMSADSAYTDITVTVRNAAAVASTFVVRTNYSLSRAGSIGVDGERGSATVYLSGYTAWNATTETAVNNYFTTNYNGKVLNDVATVYGTGFSQTRVWNGTSWVQVTVAIDGNLLVSGTVAASKISATSLSAISATIGTLRTATTGARMELKDNVILVYDASNNLRVKMGNLALV